MYKRACVAVLLLLMAAAPEAFAGSRTRAKGTGTPANDELGVMRLINAAESGYFRAQGRYATLPELIRSGVIQQTSAQSPDYSRTLQLFHLDSDPQPVTGFTLNLMLSPNGNGYHLYLTQKGNKCGLGWFSDETRVLYAGQALSCDEDRAASGSNSWPPLDSDAVVPAIRDDPPCPLPQILHEASERATELVDNLQRFTATEQIDYTEFKKNGKARNSSTELFNYAAQIEQGSSGSFWVEEYRSAKTQGNDPPIWDTGTAAFALIFHPHVIGNFDVRCEGRTDYQGTAAWQLRFEESSDPGKSFHQIRIDRSAYHLRLKGRAWIAADAYQILRMQTDLVAPVPEINLQLEHLDIAYAPVEFEKNKLHLWLPESASMHIGYRGHRYRRIHTFSHFQLFLVDTNEKVKEPEPGPSS